MNRKQAENILDAYSLMRGVVEHLGSEPGNGSKVGSEVDSREKLEADVRKFANVYYDSHLLVYDKVIELLDRQAAITSESYEGVCKTCSRVATIADLQTQVADLTAERDVWKTKCETREVAYKQANAERKRYSEQIDELRAERDEAVEAYDAHMAAHDAWHEAEDITYTRNRFAIYEQATKERIARLESERDALAADLKECMEERDYWRQEVQFCMDAAYPPSHAPERPYDPRVMAYPDREGCTTPSTLVSAMIDGLRDDVRDMVMPIIEESANAKADCERWREACGSMMDAAHEIQRIMAEMELK